jgi:hypothetical protein
MVTDGEALDTRWPNDQRLDTLAFYTDEIAGERRGFFSFYPGSDPWTV